MDSDRRPDSDDDAPDGEGVGPRPGAVAASASSTSPSSSAWTRRNHWIVLALASGACAAFNGVFAKLTTNNLTTHIGQAVARVFGLSAIENVVEIIARGTFFGLNLVFNGVMWTLFTKALARGNSTTQVSIINTSANFMLTAVLGLLIFSESLPPLWWLGAAMLVAGSVITGRKDEGGGSGGASEGGESASGPAPEPGPTTVPPYGTVPREVGDLLPEEKSDDDDDVDEDVPLIGDAIEMH